MRYYLTKRKYFIAVKLDFKKFVEIYNFYINRILLLIYVNELIACKIKDSIIRDWVERTQVRVFNK